VTEKKRDRKSRNIMEEEVDSVTVQKQGRKKQKIDEPNILE
jgi:hypothetical protein